MGESMLNMVMLPLGNDSHRPQLKTDDKAHCFNEKTFLYHQILHTNTHEVCHSAFCDSINLPILSSWCLTCHLLLYALSSCPSLHAFSLCSFPILTYRLDLFIKACSSIQGSHIVDKAFLVAHLLRIFGRIDECSDACDHFPRET